MRWFANWALAGLLGLCLEVSLGAAVTVDLGAIYVPAGTTNVNVTVRVTGGDAVTDFVGRFQVGDGGPLFGGVTNGPKLTAIDLAGSIWTTAPGGYTNFDTVAYPSQVQEINVSLNTAGQTVSCNGTLCTLRLNTTGFSGSYALKLLGTVAGDSAFGRSGVILAASLVNGGIHLGKIYAQRLANANMRIWIPSLTNQNYQIQWRPNLETGSWITLPVTLPGTGSLLQWTDDGSLTGSPPGSPSAPRRFYRAIANPRP